MEQLTKDQAVAFAENGVWKEWNYEQIAKFQLSQHILCMPFPVFHEAVEKTIGRPVYTHEFGINVDGLIAEITQDKEPPSFAEIINMLPSDKVIIVAESTEDYR